MALHRLARIPFLIAVAIAAVLVLGWVFYAFDANESTWIVGTVMDVARFFAEPFRFIFELDDNVAQIAVNWGIGAIVYLVAGALLSRLLTMLIGAVTRRRGGRGHGTRATHA